MKVKEIIIGSIFLVLFFISSNIIPPILILGVPFTLQAVVIMLIPFFMSLKNVIIWYIALLLMCLIGIPMMSNFNYGLSALFGPTSGFIYGFLFKMIMIKLLVTSNSSNIRLFIVLLLATILDLIIGGLYLAIYSNLAIIPTISSMFTSFILFGIIKIIIVIIMIRKIPKSLLY